MFGIHIQCLLLCKRRLFTTSFVLSAIDNLKKKFGNKKLSCINKYNSNHGGKLCGHKKD